MPEAGDDDLHRLAAVQPSSFWFTRRNKLIVWALRRHFPGARRALEVGCGTGFVLSGLRAAMPQLSLVGTDIHPEALRIARRRVPTAQLLELDARSLDFQSEFDVAGAFDVLEHIDEDGRVLAQLRRALRPDGGLLVTVPQHRWLWSCVDEQSGHVRRYSRGELTRKLRQAGFQPLRVTSFVSLLLPLMAATRVGRGATTEERLLRELRPRPWTNAALGFTLDLERAAIRGGATLPAGGSLLAVGRRA